MCVIRAERENVIALKGLAPAGQLPMGVLAEGKEGISSVCNMELDVTNYLSSSPPTAIVDLKDKIGSFDDASKYDRVNERMPPQRYSVVSMPSETDSPMDVTGGEQKFTYEEWAGAKN